MSVILPGQFQEDSLGASYWAGQKNIFWSSSKPRQSIMIKKCSAAVVFTSRRDDMKNKDMIKKTCLPAQSINEYKKQSSSEMEKPQQN